jgi:uncharacterized membrane protein YbhN (UPF0104 family)
LHSARCLQARNGIGSDSFRLKLKCLSLQFQSPLANLHGMNLLFGKRWWSWQRLLCIAITGAILYFIFRRIDFHSFADSLRRMRVAWFVCAFAAYGLALVLGGFRWHMSLRATARAIHPGASVRLMLIGHFFFVALFGAAGGDVAKSAVVRALVSVRFAGSDRCGATRSCARLGGNHSARLVHVCGWPCSQAVRAAQQTRSSVSRGLVFGRRFIDRRDRHRLLFWNPRGESSWARTIRAFRSGGWHFVRSPRNAAPGLLFALLSQVGLSGVFALNLAAVARDTLPWPQFAWTIPVITILSCLPFTVAGAGVREVAAMTFLGIYGVPVGDCVAASMLTFVCKISWAGIGAALLWREENLQVKNIGVVPPKTISVVIPALNEAESLPETIRRVQGNLGVGEIIVVDGGSSDATREIAEQFGCRVLTCEPGRGQQMRAGASVANGDVILLLHADTWLSARAAHAALECLRDSTVVAGGFWKEFRNSPVLLLGSKWRCAVRLLVGRRIAGDQALFIRREALAKIGGVPDMELMEEFEMCRRLRKVRPPRARGSHGRNFRAAIPEARRHPHLFPNVARDDAISFRSRALRVAEALRAGISQSPPLR